MYSSRNCHNIIPFRHYHSYAPQRGPYPHIVRLLYKTPTHLSHSWFCSAFAFPGSALVVFYGKHMSRHAACLETVVETSTRQTCQLQPYYKCSRLQLICGACTRPRWVFRACAGTCICTLLISPTCTQVELQPQTKPCGTEALYVCGWDRMHQEHAHLCECP